MAIKNTYQDSLKEELGWIIDQLDLLDLQKRALKSRWMDQVVWMEGKASKSQKKYYRLRLTSIIGGAVLTALVSLNAAGVNLAVVGAHEQFNQILGYFLSLGLPVLSLTVTLSAAIEEFCQFGARWRQYRQTVEALKSEGWQYFQLSGAYQKARSHGEAYQAFSTRVEYLIKQDVEVFVAEVLKEKEKDDGEKESENKSDLNFVPAVFNSSEPIAYSELVVTPDSVSAVEPASDS